MFEKEAEEYFEDKCGSYFESTKAEIKEDVCNAFKDGAEFGYNKANEWHFVKDGDLPPKELEEKPLLVRVRNYREEWFIAYYMLDGYSRKNGKRFYSDTKFEFPIDIKDVIAWKEVVLPELPKEIKEK